MKGNGGLIKYRKEGGRKVIEQKTKLRKVKNGKEESRWQVIYRKVDVLCGHAVSEELGPQGLQRLKHTFDDCAGGDAAVY